MRKEWSPKVGFINWSWSRTWLMATFDAGFPNVASIWRIVFLPHQKWVDTCYRVRNTKKTARFINKYFINTPFMSVITICFHSLIIFVLYWPHNRSLLSTTNSYTEEMTCFLITLHFIINPTKHYQSWDSGCFKSALVWHQIGWEQDNGTYVQENQHLKAICNPQEYHCCVNCFWMYHWSCPSTLGSMWDT